MIPTYLPSSSHSLGVFGRSGQISFMGSSLSFLRDNAPTTEESQNPPYDGF